MFSEHDDRRSFSLSLRSKGNLPCQTQLFHPLSVGGLYVVPELFRVWSNLPGALESDPTHRPGRSGQSALVMAARYEYLPPGTMFVVLDVAPGTTTYFKIMVVDNPEKQGWVFFGRRAVVRTKIKEVGSP